MQVFEINGVAVPSPKPLTIGFNDLDDNSGRNSKGDLQRDRIAIKRTIECEWGKLSTSEISIILNAVSPVFFDVRYLDPMAGGVITKTFYVGNRTAPVCNDGRNWVGLKLTLIER